MGDLPGVALAGEGQLFSVAAQAAADIIDRYRGGIVVGELRRREAPGVVDLGIVDARIVGIAKGDQRQAGGLERSRAVGGALAVVVWLEVGHEAVAAQLFADIGQDAALQVVIDGETAAFGGHGRGW